MSKPATRVACEVVIRRDDTILLGKRKGTFGAGTWALPAGHLEFDERLVDGMCREVLEELGVSVEPKDLKLVSVVDDIRRADNQHYVHIVFELRHQNFEPKLMEPESCEEWRWFPLDALPLDNFFIAHRGSIENYLAGRLYLL